jgi:predicted phosphoribosyltransferase
MNGPLFENREAAGKALATELKKRHLPKDTLVLGLPRGGVPVAWQIAKALKLELDILSIRKLGLPRHPEVAMGAIAEDGTRFLDQELIRQAGVTPEDIARVQAMESDTLAARIKRFRQVKVPAIIRGRTVVLVDDGVATGATMELAVLVLRKKHPARIIVAVPVGPSGTTQRFADVADDCVCLLEPQVFSSVGLWYLDFHQVPEQIVVEALEASQRCQIP